MCGVCVCSSALSCVCVCVCVAVLSEVWTGGAAQAGEMHEPAEEM